MNFTTNQFGYSSPFSQQLQPPMMQGGQYQGPQAITPTDGYRNPIPNQAMQAAQPGMSPQQKMMLVQMLQNMGNRPQMPQLNLAGVTGSTLPNNFLG